MEKEYYLVPSMGSVFEVTPNCCFRQVIFDGAQTGIKYHRDDPTNDLNSWNLQSYTCGDNLTIIPVPKQIFDDKCAYVNTLNRHLYN